MTNVIAVSFNSEIKAVKALHKLNELELFGVICIYDKVMIRADSDGLYDILREGGFDGWRGIPDATKRVISAIPGGPVGIVTGLLGGFNQRLIACSTEFGLSDDFIRSVKKIMAAGTVSIIAEVNEYVNEIVETNFRKFDPVISKSNITYRMGNHASEKLNKIDRDISGIMGDLTKSLGRSTTSISDRIIELKLKRKNWVAELEMKLEETENSFNDSLVKVIAEMKPDIGETRLKNLRKRIPRHKAKLNLLN